MIEFWQIFATAVITAAASSLFGYLQEKKISSSRYTEMVLTELYVPIYKILTERIVPGDGYEGIDEDQLDSIKTIIDKKPELADPKLDSLVYGYFEDIFHNWNRLYADQVDNDKKVYDSDRQLLDYILISFNKTRKSLGLPYDKKYAFPILIKLKVWQRKYYHNRKIKKLRRLQKKLK